MINCYKSLFFLIGINFIITSCHYPKVKVTNEEYNSIVYKNKVKLIFENENKIQDTVLIYSDYPNGFEPNFDFWWNKKILKNNSLTTKRSFGKKYATYTNFEKNKFKKANLNLGLFFSYTKTENDSSLILSATNFKEKYILKNFSLNDTLIFRHDDNSGKCNDENCLKKIKYLKSIGIVLIEKGNGEIWKLK